MAKTKKTPAKKPVDPNARKPEDGAEDESEDGEDDEDGDLNGRVNAIVTSRLKRFESKLDTQLSAITEALGKLVKPADAADEDDESDETDEGEEAPADAKAGKKTVTAKLDPATTRRMTRLERELKEEKEARKRAEREKSEAAEKAQRDEEKSIFVSALAKQGVTDSSLSKGALMTLIADGKIIRDEDGKIKFRGVDKYGLEANLDPEIGVGQWLKSEGKAYVPAAPVGGSGGDGARAGGASQSLSRTEYQKLSAVQRAAIELDRASRGEPPLQ